jgi:hypothetical protein
MAGETVLDTAGQSLVRRWLEFLLPAYTLAFLVVLIRPEYMPHVLGQNINESIVPWVSWAVVGAMTGILMLWALIVTFFVIYSPFYLLGKLPMLVGRGAWVDRRELQFYLGCFLLLVLLALLTFWAPRKALVVFTVVAGWGPVFWRYVV